MNPFLEEPFLDWNKLEQRDPKIRTEQHEILKKTKFSFDDLVELFLYYEKKGKLDLSSLLYYFYFDDYVTSKLSYKANSSKYIAGYFADEFYLKLIKKLNKKSQAYLFPFLPPHLQTDEQLINYFKNNPEAKLNNFKRTGKLSEKIILILLDIAFNTIVKTMPKAWWNSKLKKKAYEKDPLSLLFMPSTVVTKDEIIKVFQDYSSLLDKLLFLFSSNSLFDEKFKKDPEIRAEFALNIDNLKVLKSDFFKNATYEFFRYYLEHVKPSLNNKEFVHMIPEKYLDKQLIDLIIEKMPYEAIFYLDHKLTNKQLQKIYDISKKIGIGHKEIIVNLILKMKQHGLFKIDMLGDFNKILYEDLENVLTASELKQFMTSEVVDYYFKVEDNSFFKTKQTMKYIKKLDKKKLYVLLKHLSYLKLKSRINYKLTNDDFAYLYLTARTDISLEPKKRNEIIKNLKRLIDDFVIDISKEFVKQLENLPDNTKYEAYKDIINLFIF